MTPPRHLLLALLVCWRLLPAMAAERPDIIWIWADNLAFGDLGIYDGAPARTPRIDRLARTGVRFTNYYVAHTVCSPSRAALLTGRQPFRSGIVDVLRPDSPIGLPDEEITLAEALRSEGYETMAIGKWHLGDRRPYLPTSHGFDHYFGMPYSMDMAPSHLYRDEEIIEDLAGSKVENITERYTAEAIRFVAARRERPFFLYLSHTLPHPPINLPRQARTAGASLYQDAIAHLDEQTGRLLDELERVGLARNTLVFFSSDNGPMDAGGRTGVLRGRIRDAYEGGIRVPLIASWPGRLPAGRLVENTAIAYDIIPT
jgi:arylsulfatase